MIKIPEETKNRRNVPQHNKVEVVCDKARAYITLSGEKLKI
jgi:hypothetical protein